jgi:hypothetical protein
VTNLKKLARYKLFRPPIRRHGKEGFATLTPDAEADDSVIEQQPLRRADSKAEPEIDRDTRKLLQNFNKVKSESSDVLCYSRKRLKEGQVPML